MKGEKSKSCANRTDRRWLSVRIGGGKAIKVPNLPIMPKKPPRPISDLTFFTWMLFSDQFKAKYPNSTSYVDLHNAALEEWEIMSDADKAPYVKMAEESRKGYETGMKEFRKKKAEYDYIYAAYYKNSRDSAMKYGKWKSHGSKRHVVRKQFKAKSPYVKMTEESMKDYEAFTKEYNNRAEEYYEYISAAADYKNNQGATNVEEEVRINLAGMMIRQ